MHKGNLRLYTGKLPEVVGHVADTSATRLTATVQRVAISPLVKWRADKAIGSVRKVPWVLSLRGALLVLFSRQGEKSTYSNRPINCNLKGTDYDLHPHLQPRS